MAGADPHAPAPSLRWGFPEEDEEDEEDGEDGEDIDFEPPSGRAGLADLDDAVTLLRDLLADGPMSVKDLRAELKGLPERAVRKAKKRLGVVSERQDPHDPRSPWVWRSARMRRVRPGA